jgi:hypothetical protein
LVVTRRALLGAGALALLSGCGPPEEAEVVPAEVLSEQLRAEERVVAAYVALPDGSSSIDAPWRPSDLRARASARIDRLEAAGAKASGAPVDPPATPGLEAVLEAERRALREHVRALGLLRDPKWTELLAGLITSGAAHETALLELLERPPLPSAFPGQPIA